MLYIFQLKQNGKQENLILARVKSRNTANYIIYCVFVS